MKRLSGLDASFLYFETPEQLLHVCGVVVLDPATIPGGYTFATMRDAMEARVRAVPEFRQKLRSVPLKLDHPVWVDDDHFDIERHVHRAALPAPGDARALAELARVTRPGGHLLLEFYNPLSLRYPVKRLKRPTAVATGVDDEQVYTRYDTTWQIEQRLPAGLKLLGWRGIRVVTPFAGVHRVPGLRQLFGAAERLVADGPLGQLGGFVVAVVRKLG